MKPKTHPIGRILAILLILASLGASFLNWIGISYINLNFTFFDAVQEALEGDFGSDTEQMIVVIAAGLLVLTALIGVICAACGAKGGLVPFLIAALVMLGGAIYLVGEVNKEAYGFGVAKIGVGAYLCPALALGALLAMFIPGAVTARAPAPAMGYAPVNRAPASLAGSWTCPGCGTILADRERFCPNCGSSRAPAARRCASCGAELDRGVGFCSNCGAPVTRAAAPTEPAGGRYDRPTGNGSVVFRNPGDGDL